MSRSGEAPPDAVEASGPAPAGSASEIFTEQDPVRVEHELVELESVPTLPPVPRGATHAPAQAVRHIQTASRATEPAGFVARAGRLLMGDGRHRPEPFPRLTD